MAGETTKTASLTRVETGKMNDAKVNSRKLCVRQDVHAVTTAELQLADVMLFDIKIPSNAVIRGVEVFNDDLDADASPALTLDIGLVADIKFEKVVSGVKSFVAAGTELDIDLLVDGSTVGQAATARWTHQNLPSATIDAAKANKEVWELLGYDKDPNTEFRVAVKAATAAATAQAGDLAVSVQFLSV